MIGDSALCDYVDEFRRCYTKCNRPDTEGQIHCNFTHVKKLKRQTLRSRVEK
jgi:hypothetical protein